GRVVVRPDVLLVFVFSSRRRHTICYRDWSSDVCSSDLHFGTAPFVKLDTGRLTLRVRPLLWGRIEFGALTLTRPAITLIRNPDGQLNIASLGPGADPRVAARAGRGGAAGAGGGGTGAATLASSVRIEKGTVTYVTRGG